MAKIKRVTCPQCMGEGAVHKRSRGVGATICSTACRACGGTGITPAIERVTVEHDEGNRDCLFLDGTLLQGMRAQANCTRKQCISELIASRESGCSVLIAPGVDYAIEVLRRGAE